MKIARDRFAELLATHPSTVRADALATYDAVAARAPGASVLLYRTHATTAVFSFTAKLGAAFTHVPAYGKKVNLGFNRGVDLPDPDGVLEGTGKKIRHISVTGTDALDAPTTRTLIDAAVAQGELLAQGKGPAEPRLVDKATS